MILDDPRFEPARQALGPLATQLADVTGRAFISGMDRAFIISAGFIMGCAVLSFLLINDRVASTVPADADEANLAPAPAD